MYSWGILAVSTSFIESLRGILFLFHSLSVLSVHSHSPSVLSVHSLPVLPVAECWRQNDWTSQFLIYPSLILAPK
jgi:hypothetical protein